MDLDAEESYLQPMIKVGEQTYPYP